MARTVQIILEDDLSGGPADETVKFALDGVAYEIDLSAKNADRLRSSLQQFVDNARKTSGRTSRRPASAGKGRASEIREWAQANGIAVNARGRISADVVAQYEAAQR